MQSTKPLTSLAQKIQNFLTQNSISTQVKILAVSKTQTPEKIQKVYNEGRNQKASDCLEKTTLKN